jgi:hypothetical protein
MRGTIRPQSPCLFSFHDYCVHALESGETLKATLSRKDKWERNRSSGVMFLYVYYAILGPSQPRSITQGDSYLKCVCPFTRCDFCRCRLFSSMDGIFPPIPAYGICSGARITAATVRRVMYYAGVGLSLHLRTVDETFRTTEDEEIVEKCRDEAATARTNDRTPDPIMVTECEHCQWEVLAHCQRGRPR